MKTMLLLLQLRLELNKLARMPAFLVSVTALPLFFYLATATSDKLPDLTEGYKSTQYLLCTLGTFGIFGITLFGFGVNFAIERSQGWFLSLRATPIPIRTLFLAKLLACMVLSGVAVLLLFAEAVIVMGVTLPAESWLLLFLCLVAGCIPLAAFSMVIGTFCGPNSVSIVAIMCYLGVASLSGLLAPLSMLRKGNPELADMALYYPTYHVYSLSLNALRPSWGAMGTHLLVLAVYTIAFSAIAMRAFRSNLNRTIG